MIDKKLEVKKIEEIKTDEKTNPVIISVCQKCGGKSEKPLRFCFLRHLWTCNNCFFEK